VGFSDPFGLCKDANGNDLPEEQCRQMLTAAQDNARANPSFQPSNGLTWCNQATESVAKEMNAPMAPFSNGQGGHARANEIATNLAAPGSGYRVVPTAGEAVRLAGKGDLVIAVQTNPNGPGHVAPLRTPGLPGETSGLPGRRGPVVSNVGGSVGVGRTSAFFNRNRTITYYTPDE